MSPEARTAERAYTLVEAAEVKSVSRDLLLRAIKATEGNTLRAKKVGKGYRVTASDLDAWYERLEDA
jgi:excisionase family DNA binding protein